MRIAGAADVIENALHEDDMDVDAAGDVRQELCYQVADGFGGEAYDNALRGVRNVGADARDVEVGDLRGHG